jgi:type I restriction enzyme S subunit
MIVRPGDLLVSLTRPTRRAIAFIPGDLPLAIASNGFAVIRNIDETRVLSRFLFHLLRSRLCVAQFDQRSSGGNYPAMSEDQLLRVLIPIPDLRDQLRIIALLDQQYDEVSWLLRTAEDDMQTLKHDIETLILTEGQKL